MGCLLHWSHGCTRLTFAYPARMTLFQSAKTRVRTHDELASRASDGVSQILFATGINFY